MVGSKLTINARMPGSVRVRGHLRWHGALPGRVQGNAQERFRPESVQTDWFHAPGERRGPARGPGSPPVVLAPRKAPRPRGGRRPGLTALPPPRLPRTVLEPSPNRPRIVPEGSGQFPGRIRPGFPTARTAPTPGGGRPCGRHPASPHQPLLTSRSAAESPGQTYASIPAGSLSAATSAWARIILAVKSISTVAGRVAASARTRRKENQRVPEHKPNSLTSWGLAR